MTEDVGINSVGRFSGLAEVYQRCRPDYPEAAVDFLLAHCGLGRGALLVDVGSGTGIASRQLARRGLRVLGVEPNEEMRRIAEGEPLPEGAVGLSYREGRAEATGLPDGCADAVLSAQAFHWFEPGTTLQEFHRILKPGGWAALMWNERDASDAFTAAYGEVVRSTRDGARVEASRATAGDALLRSALFERAERVSFQHAQVVDEEGLLGRALSNSYAPREPEAIERFTAALREVFRGFQQKGSVLLRYNTSVYVGRRSEETSG